MKVDPPVTQPGASPEHHNEVRIVGRVSDDPEVIVLPSGDEIVTARLVVNRPRPPAGKGKRAGVDTIPCTAWKPSARRRLRVWDAGDIVEITGSLRRRFWRDGGARSRYEVEVDSARRLARAPKTRA